MALDKDLDSLPSAKPGFEKTSEDRSKPGPVAH